MNPVITPGSGDRRAFLQQIGKAASALALVAAALTNLDSSASAAGQPACCAEGCCSEASCC